jgi:hypothetical protein
MRFLKRNIAAVIVAAVVVGASGAAYAAKPARPTLTSKTAANAAGSAPSAQPGTPAGRRGMKPGGFLRRAVHGDLVVRGKAGFENVTFDRGTLTSVDGNRLTIARPDGPSVTVTLTDATRYRGVAGKDALVTGKPTMVVSKDGNALMVGQPKERPAASNRAGGSGTLQP